MDEPFYLSASTIKSWSSCSLRYFYSKVLRIPEKTNTGALRGTAAHSVLECLLRPRHKKKFDQIFKSGEIKKNSVVYRYIESYVKKNALDKEDVDKICNYIVVGVSYDFFCKGGEIVGAEIPFEIGSKEDGYFIRGFIDKLALYKKEDKVFARLVDFKSSKQKFQGKELYSNIQAFTYCLALKKMYPNLDFEAVVDFIFLQFPEDPRQRVRPTEEDLKQFENYLKEIYPEIANFSYENRLDNVAKFQPYPSEGFGGPMSCGRAKFKGEMKKDGSSEVFFCPYKFALDYFALIDKDGNVLKTSFDKDNLNPNFEAGESVIPRRHSKCEVH